MAERKVGKVVSDSSVSFEFFDGSTLEATLGSMSDDMITKLALHGLSQKIGDSYSGEEAANCQTIAETTYKALVEGNWSTRTGGNAGPRISQLAEALSRATGEDIQTCVAKIAEMTDDTKKDLRAHPAIQAIVAEIKLEKAAADNEKAKAAAAAAGGEEVDLGDLFA